MIFPKGLTEEHFMYLVSETTSSTRTFYIYEQLKYDVDCLIPVPGSLMELQCVYNKSDEEWKPIKWEIQGDSHIWLSKENQEAHVRKVMDMPEDTLKICRAVIEVYLETNRV